MKTPMNESEIQAMNNSFKILHERRRNLLDNDETRELKERVKKIREYSINHLEELKVEAVEKLQDNGIEVVYADDSAEALKAIYDLVKDEECVAKSKSNTASEIGITDFFQDKGIKLVETDLGDRIVQFTAKKKSSHPIGPAAHLSLEEIAQIIREEFNREVKSDPQEILDIVKQDVLDGISHCKVGITGANSLAAEDGSSGDVAPRLAQSTGERGSGRSEDPYEPVDASNMAAPVIGTPLEDYANDDSWMRSEVASYADKDDPYAPPSANIGQMANQIWNGSELKESESLNNIMPPYDGNLVYEFSIGDYDVWYDLDDHTRVVVDKTSEPAERIEYLQIGGQSDHNMYIPPSTEHAIKLTSPV